MDGNEGFPLSRSSSYTFQDPNEYTDLQYNAYRGSEEQVR